MTFLPLAAPKPSPARWSEPPWASTVMPRPLPAAAACEPLCALVKQLAKGPFEFGVTEAIAAGLQAGGLHALAAEEHLLHGFAAEQGLEGERGRGQQRRPAEHAIQGASELLVGDGVGRREVHRPACGAAVEEVEDGAHLVVDGDPAPPLPPGPDAATDAELEREEHLLESPALGAEHQAGAEVHNAYAGVFGGSGRRLPLLAHLGEEAGARA